MPITSPLINRPFGAGSGDAANEAGNPATHAAATEVFKNSRREVWIFTATSLLKGTPGSPVPASVASPPSGGKAPPSQGHAGRT